MLWCGPSASAALLLRPGSAWPACHGCPYRIMCFQLTSNEPSGGGRGDEKLQQLFALELPPEAPCMPVASLPPVPWSLGRTAKCLVCSLLAL